MQSNASESSEEYNPMVNEEIKLTEQENRARQEMVYEWVARYKDGTSLRQYDDEKQLVHHFGYIDQDKIYEFEIVPTKAGLLPVKVNLETGLFYFNDEPLLGVHQGNSHISLGLALSNKQVKSSWGDKAKLIYVRHVRRKFSPSPSGTGMDVSMEYELGWEADVDGVREKHCVSIDENGMMTLPRTFEQDGYNPL